jgi:hypothetical protein
MSETHHHKVDTAGGINIDREVRSAYRLLRDAEKQSIHVPKDVVTAITDAHISNSETGKFRDRESEARFWNAYGLLSSIKPADDATAHYKYGLYTLIILLICFQLYYLAGSLVLSHLASVEAEWQAAADSSSTAQNADHTNSALWNKLRRTATAKANYDLARRLIPFFREPQLPDEFFDSYKGVMPRGKVQFTVSYIKLKAELELHVLALSGYILPLLYGALGAFAFLLRKLSDPAAKLTYADDARVSSTLRLHVGALAGLAIGWFVNRNSANSGLGSLSPLALAFAAGYASDLLFTVLDKLVGAFDSATSPKRVENDETSAELNAVTEFQRRTRNGGSAPAAIGHEQRSGANEGENTRSSSVHQPKAA